MTQGQFLSSRESCKSSCYILLLENEWKESGLQWINIKFCMKIDKGAREKHK